MTKVYSLSKFTMNKRTLLLNPSDCSSHGVFSESSGNDPFLSVGGAGQEWTQDTLTKADFEPDLSREAKNILLFSHLPK